MKEKKKKEEVEMGSSHRKAAFEKREPSLYLSLFQQKIKFGVGTDPFSASWIVIGCRW